MKSSLLFLSAFAVAAATTTTAKAEHAAPLPCVDMVNPGTSRSDCPSVQYLCNDPSYKEVLAVKCPATCGVCPPPIVAAAAADDVSSAPLSLSSPNGASEESKKTCVDKVNRNTNVSDCPKMVHMCADPSFSGFMSENCPKTCGRC